MKIGAQLYTLHDRLDTPEAFIQALKRVKAMSYETAQPSAVWHLPAQVIADGFKEAGLEAPASHVDFEKLITSDIDAIIADHHLIGCPIVGIGGMPERFRQDGETSYLAFAQKLNEVAKALKANGLGFLYHNHAFEFVRFGKKTGLDILFENTSDDVQFEIDTHWVQAGGADPVAWIYKVEGRMSVVHFKDMAGSNENKPQICEVGSGNLNWPAILKACKDTGVAHALVEQDTCPGDPFDSLEQSITFLRSIGA